MTSLPAPKASWIVGRTPLLEHAATDYLNELTRQQPWLRSRREDLLDDLSAFLGDPAPLSAYTAARAQSWRRGLPEAEQAEAAAFLADFSTYLREWGWLE